MDYYTELMARVQSGTLKIFSMIAPPRTGSTLVSKHVYNTFLRIDAQATEPAAQIGSGENRVIDTYKYIYEAVIAAENNAHTQERNLHEEPIIFLTKNLTFHIGPTQEWERFNKLVSDTHIVTLRNPVATLESYLLAALQTMEANYTARHQEIDLKTIVKEGADLSHIDWGANISPLKQHIEFMKRNRDYSSLEDKVGTMLIMDFPLMGTSSFQEAVWDGERQAYLHSGISPDAIAQHAYHKDWAAMVASHLGSAGDKLRILPEPLRKPFNFLRFGWHSLLPQLKNVPEGKNIALLDYTDFQLAPAFYLDRIREVMGGALGIDSNSLVIQKNNERKPFDIGPWKGKPNAKYFLGDAMREGPVDLPSKSPLPWEKFPDFLKPHLEESLAIYMKALCEYSRLKPPFSVEEKLSMCGKDGRLMSATDPVQMYIEVTLSSEEVLASRNKILKQLRTDSTEYTPYFDMVDRILETISQEKQADAILLLPNGVRAKLPIIQATSGPDAIDINTLFDQTGVIAFDKRLLNTATTLAVHSSLDGKKGKLWLRGIAIEELVEKSNYLETAFLLLTGELPTANQLDNFRRLLGQQTILSSEVKDGLTKVISAFPRNDDPMHIMSAAACYMASHDDIMFDTPENQLQASVRAMAIMPLIMGCIYAHYQNKPFRFPQEKDFGPGFIRFDYTQNFIAMLSGAESNQPEYVKHIDTMLLLLAEHLTNPSTVTMEQVMSTAPEFWQGLGAAMHTISAPKHVGASRDVLKMLHNLSAQNGEIDKIVTDFVESVVAHNMSRAIPKKVIPGFGNAAYDVSDPRARIMKRMAEKILMGGDNQRLFEIASALEEKVMATPYFLERKTATNVEYYMGSVLQGFHIHESFIPAFFTVGRVPGLAAHTILAKQTGRATVRYEQVYVGLSERSIEQARETPLAKDPFGLLMRGGNAAVQMQI